MAYSVVTGPINFGAAPTGPEGEGSTEIDPFMEQLSTYATASVAQAAEDTLLQPAGSLPKSAVPTAAPSEHAHSRAPAQHGLMQDAFANAEEQTLKESSAEAVIASSPSEASSKALPSNRGADELTSLALLGQPHDRQRPASEVNEASAPPNEEARSFINSCTMPASVQHATEVIPQGAGGEAAEPISPELEQSAFQASSSLGTLPASAGAADATSREGHRSPRLLQQQDYTAPRALVKPTTSSVDMKPNQRESASLQPKEQDTLTLLGLQPLIPDQSLSPASINHPASDPKGPPEGSHLRTPEQAIRRPSVDFAAQAGTPNLSQITTSQSASTQQDAALQPIAGVIHSAGQEARPHFSTTRQSAGTLLQEWTRQAQSPGSTSERMSVSAGDAGGTGLKGAHGAAHLKESGNAVSTIRPAAAAPDHEHAQSLHNSAGQTVPSASEDKGTSSGSNVQDSELQQGSSVPAHSPLLIVTDKKELAQSQLDTAEEALTPPRPELTASLYEGSSIAGQINIPSLLVSSASPAQPADSEHLPGSRYDAEDHGSPGDGPAPSAAPLSAIAEVTNAAGAQHGQAQLRNDMGRLEAGTQASDLSQAGSDRATHHTESEAVTQEELLALADAVSRLEAELVDAQEATARHEQEAEAARQEAAQWRDREADARAQLVAVREAYADMRSAAETAQAQLSELQATEDGLQKQLSACVQQARASEESKMRSRLDRAERAIEQERAANRDLQAALQASRQGGAAREDVSAGKMAAELAAVRRDLAEATAALASQRASNRGLQIRVAELLKGSTDMAALREACTQLKQQRDALLASKHQWTTNETLLASLKAQNNALHVTTEKLVSTNSELMDRMNRQSEQVTALQDALDKAQAAQAPRKESLQQQERGGSRVTQTELELMALAEYVRELEGKMAKQQADFPGRQGSQISPTGLATTGAPDLPPEGPGGRGHDQFEQSKTDTHEPGQESATATREETSGDQQQNTVQESKLPDQAGAGQRRSGDADDFSDEQVDAIKAALRPKSAQQGQHKQQSKGFWGYITDYITGADKLIQ